MTNGQRLRQLRREKNLNQAEIGKILGIKAQAVSAYERDETPLSLARIHLLCKEFGISLDEFIYDKEENTSKKVNTFDSEMVEELRSTMDFLKKQIEVMNKEKEQLSTMLELALRGNFPEGSSNISTGEKEVKSLGYTPLKLVG